LMDSGRFYFKGCARCRGDLYLEDDFYGAYWRCMQCGRLTDVELREPGKLVAKSRSKELAA